MSEIKLQKHNHVLQWIELKQIYGSKRGLRIGALNGKTYPKTTNGDVKTLTKWWYEQFQRSYLRNPFAEDHDQRSLKGWIQSKQQIDKELEGVDPSAEYPRNEWFWQEVTQRLSKYLAARQDQPTPFSIFVDAVSESAQDRVEDVVSAGKAAGEAVIGAGEAVIGAGKAVAGAGERAVSGVVSVLKKGLLIAGGVLGAAILLPPVIRALREPKDTESKAHDR